MLSADPNHRDLVSLITANQSERMSMSIRPQSGGLAFALWSDIPCEELYARGFLEISSGYRYWWEAIQDLFFRHEFLCMPYHHVQLYYRPLHRILVPKEHYEEGREELWMCPVSPTSGGDALEQRQILSCPLQDEGKVQILSWSAPLYRFLQRTHLCLQAIPDYMPWLEARKRQMRQRSHPELCVMLHPDGIDCWLLAQGETLYTNGYAFVRAADLEVVVGEIGFYILALYRAHDLANRGGSVRLCYNLDATDIQIEHDRQVLSRVQALLSQSLSQLELDTHSVTSQRPRSNFINI